MSEGKISHEESLAYLAAHRDRGARSLMLLRQLHGFVEAINTELGQLLLADLITLHKESLEKISALSASDEDKIIHRVAGMIIGRWSEKIQRYNGIREGVKNAAA